MNFTKSIILTFCLVLIALSCKTNDDAPVSTTEKSTKIIFDADLSENLYKEMEASSEGVLSFSQQQLSDLLKIADPAELKNGNSYAVELLFEPFECNCLDKMDLSYDNKQDAFILYIYEETYVEDMDTCSIIVFANTFDILVGNAFPISFHFSLKFPNIL